MHLPAKLDGVIPTTHVHVGNTVAFASKSDFLYKFARILLASKCRNGISHAFTCFIKTLLSLRSFACSLNMHVSTSIVSLRRYYSLV